LFRKISPMRIIKKQYPFRQGYSINKNMILKKQWVEYITNEIHKIGMTTFDVEDEFFDIACENAMLKMTD